MEPIDTSIDSPHPNISESPKNETVSKELALSFHKSICGSWERAWEPSHSLRLLVSSRNGSQAPELIQRAAIKYGDKTYPKNESKREDIRDSKSEKNGMTSAMVNAPSQVKPRIPPQEAHPTRV